MGLNTLYHIMDYGGNYYRTNQINRLVAVDSEQEADVFTFAQANRLTCVGKEAELYCMIPIDEAEDDNEKEYISPVKELAYEEISLPVKKKIEFYQLSDMDWEAYLNHFIYLIEGIGNYRNQLSSQFSDVDMKICDILHYIELCETNEQEATDLIKLLRICRENRRDIKDKMQIIDNFQNDLGTNENLLKAKKMIKVINGLDTRKYKPRKYEELFENCTLKKENLQRKDIYEQEDSEKKHNFCKKRDYNTKGDEIIMINERNPTPFDKMENDWLSFAREQARFYRNAEKYMNNIQLDINEIDSEIESVLEDTENARCNVAQGYNVFKRLKQLRLEKKKKLRELNCLHALTDYIDCQALADTCEDNLTEIEDIIKASDNEEEKNSLSVGNKEENIQEMII